MLTRAWRGPQVTDNEDGKLAFPSTPTTKVEGPFCAMVNALLNPDPSARLGGDGVRSHEWFAQTDWDGLAKGEAASPLHGGGDEGHWLAKRSRELEAAAAGGGSSRLLDRISSVISPPPDASLFASFGAVRG